MIDRREPWPTTLRISSCMAPIADPYVAALARWLAEELDQPVKFVESADWRTREAMFDRGQIDVIWICGLPYVRKADDPSLDVRLLVAPVMAGSRYQGRPVYFSDVMVRRDSPHRSFADLRGVSWCFNEPGSHSGFNLTRYQLAQAGLDWSYFGRVVEAGSHQACVGMILAGEADAAAIDSTVLELVDRDRPDDVSGLRKVATFGPSPIPPWLARGDLDARLRRDVRQAMLSMARSAQGRRVMESIGQREFCSVDDVDYERIREMDRQASSVRPPDEVA